RAACGRLDSGRELIFNGGTVHNRRASVSKYASAAIPRRRALADGATKSGVYPIAAVVVHNAMVDDPAVPELYGCRAGRHVNKRDSAALGRSQNASRKTLNGPVLDRAIAGAN